MNHPPPPQPRSIIHVDMDAFFASIEQRDHPELKGKPVLVGYDGPRGVVAAASYEARQFGCHSAQPMSIAKRRCQHAVIMPVRAKHYRQVSKQIFQIFEAFSPAIEPLSVDEAFLDMTGTEQSLGPPEESARQIKHRIRTELNLVASIGLAPNKFLAKLASDLEKPDGLTIIRQSQIDDILTPLPISKIWGVGKVTAEKLKSRGINTIGDLRAKSLEQLQHYVGNEAQRYWNLAHGIDNRPVVTTREAKSISHEHTFEINVNDKQSVRQTLLNLTELVARRLRKHDMAAHNISLKIRYGDFKTITRSKSLSSPTNITDDLWNAASEVFEQWTFQPVRLIGITAARLTNSNIQSELFTDASRDKQIKLDEVADKITDKFGKTAIKRG